MFRLILLSSALTPFEGHFFIKSAAGSPVDELFSYHDNSLIKLEEVSE